MKVVSDTYDNYRLRLCYICTYCQEPIYDKVLILRNLIIKKESYNAKLSKMSATISIENLCVCVCVHCW